MNKVITKEIDLNGRKLKLETGKLALQADASVMASIGETVVLATVATRPQKQDIGYFPLSVEYVEKHYAGGRISSSKFIKRENRPSEGAVLTGRLIDRSIRPFFPKECRTQILRYRRAWRRLRRVFYHHPILEKRRDRIDRKRQ